MLFSVKFHWLSFVGFFHCINPQGWGIWQYVLLFGLSGSDIAHILKIDWSYLRYSIG